MPWYIETKFETQKQQNYRARYFERRTTRNPILLWIDNFKEHGSAETLQSSEGPSTSNEHKNNVSNYFKGHPTRSIRRAENDLQISPREIWRIQNARKTAQDRLSAVVENMPAK